MKIVVITPPGELVSLADLKAHLRVDHNDDDPYIAALGEAAQQWLDGPSGWLGLSLSQQTLEVIADGFSSFSSSEIALPCPPISTITGVSYLDSSGSAVTLQPSDYQLVDGVLAPASGKFWPRARAGLGAVRIRYTAGYTTLPAPIKQAILLLVGQWYAAREVASERPQSELPFAVNALLAPFRVWN